MWSDDIIIVFGLVRYAFFDDTCSRWWYWNIGQDIQYTMNIHYKSTLLLNARSSNNQAITTSNLYLRNIYFRFDDFCWEIAWNRNLNVCTICLAFATKSSHKNKSNYNQYKQLTMFPSVLGSLALRSIIIPAVQSAFSYAMNLSLHLPPANVVITAWSLIGLIVSTFIVLPIIIINNRIIVVVKSAIHYCNRHLHRSSTSNDDTIICPSTEKVLRSSQAFHGVCNPPVAYDVTPKVVEEVVPPVQTPPKKKKQKKMKKQSVATPVPVRRSARIAAKSTSDRQRKTRKQPTTPAKRVRRSARLAARAVVWVICKCYVSICDFRCDIHEFYNICGACGSSLYLCEVQSLW